MSFTLVAALGSLIALACVVFYYRRNAYRNFNVPGFGCVIFDRRQRFKYANDFGSRYLPFLKHEENVTYRRVLDYLFDYAVPMDEGLKAAIGSFLQKEDLGGGFREVFQTDEGLLCLAETHSMPGGNRLLYLTDVTRLKEREDELLQLHKDNYELINAIEAATSGILITDMTSARHPIIFANDAFYKQIGKQEELLEDANWEFLLDGFERSQDLVDMITAITKGKEANVTVKKTKDRLDEWFNVKLTPVKNKNGDVIFLVAIFNDVTEQKIQEREFFQSKKLESLGQLAAGVAHDFNNILSIVDGYARMTEKNVTGENKDDIQEYIRKIRTASKRGSELTRQMLTFGQHKVTTEETIDITAIIEEQKSLLMPLLEPDVVLELDLNVDEAFVAGTAGSMTQIIMNLCINARDAMPNGGTLSITLSEKPETSREHEAKSDEFLYLHVQDTGTGMDQNTLERVLDPFFTTKGQGKGTGLGLSMVYGMLREMDGWIDIESEVGLGTCVTLCFPKSKVRPRRQVSGSVDDIDSVQLDGYTAVVAEDEPDLLLLVADMLEKLGVSVLRATNGNEALLLLDEYPGHIDLLLTDVVMPELDGVKLAELFQSLEPSAKIIFMSGYPANGQMAKIDIPEDADFLAKPLVYEDVAKMIYYRLSNIGKEAQGHAQWKSQNSSDTEKVNYG